MQIPCSELRVAIFTRSSCMRRSAVIIPFLISIAFFAPLALAADNQLELPKDLTELQPKPAETKVLSWHEQEKPKLNFLELSGYFRVRADAMSRCDLGTFIHQKEMGTSECPPPITYFSTDLNNPDTGNRPR